MNHNIKIVCGDYSNDGHGMTESITIKSNLTKDELATAYKNGSKILGLDFKKQVAVDYEDDKLSQNQMDLLNKHNIYVELDEHYQDDEAYSLSPQSYIDIILKICMLGNYNFTFEFTKSDNFNVGGYGTFAD